MIQEPTVIHLVLKRLDKMEEKIDQLLASHWKRIGISISASFVFSIIFALVIAYIEKH